MTDEKIDLVTNKVKELIAENDKLRTYHRNAVDRSIQRMQEIIDCRSTIKKLTAINILLAITSISLLIGLVVLWLKL